MQYTREETEDMIEYRLGKLFLNCNKHKDFEFLEYYLL